MTLRERLAEFEEKAKEAAQQWAIKVTGSPIQCPACGEEALWHHCSTDFEMGARFGFLAGWKARGEADMEMVECDDLFSKRIRELDIHEEGMV